MDLRSRALAVILGGQGETGNRGYVFVLPTEKNGIETPRRMGFPRKKGCWGQGQGRKLPAPPY